MATSASDEEINISFRPTPNYAALAEAAVGSSNLGANKTGQSKGWMKGEQARTVKELRGALMDASTRVHEQGKGMLIEAVF